MSSTLDERSRTEAASPTKRSDELIVQSFARLDGTAFGVAIGVLLGSLIFSATVFLILKGGRPIGPNLGLLSHYYPGYDVTFKGALWGLFYGFLSGFLLGWFMAFLRNSSLRLYLRFVQKRAEVSSLNDFLDRI